jgi:hypothetical protein
VSALVELCDRIESTNLRIRESQKALRTPDAPKSILFTIRSLEKVLTDLERAFVNAAKDEELEVCKYRLIPELGLRPKITAIAKAWTRYQELFSSVYDSIQKTNGRRSRTSKQAKLETEFAYAYTFSGSIGVALTLPVGQMSGFRARDLEAVNKIITDMAKAQDPEKLGAFVESLGVGPVAKLGQWVDAHVALGAGAGIEWEISQEVAPQPLIVQVPEFEVLRTALTRVSEPQVRTEPVIGVLRMADMDNHTFRMKPDGGGEPIRGTFDDAISEEQKAQLPRRYKALIRTTTEVQPAFERVKKSTFLVQLLEELPMS